MLKKDEIARWITTEEGAHIPIPKSEKQTKFEESFLAGLSGGDFGGVEINREYTTDNNGDRLFEANPKWNKSSRQLEGLIHLDTTDGIKRVDGVKLHRDGSSSIKYRNSSTYTDSPAGFIKEIA